MRLIKSIRKYTLAHQSKLSLIVNSADKNFGFLYPRSSWIVEALKLFDNDVKAPGGLIDANTHSLTCGRPEFVGLAAVGD